MLLNLAKHPLNQPGPVLRTRGESIKILTLIRKQITGKTTLGKIGEQESSSPFRVLISTILSARTKDPVTEGASERLFARYPDSKRLSNADPAVIAGIIRSVLYHNTKGRRVVEAAKMIEERFSGRVPSSFEDLESIPGVGRKTANCVLVYGFGAPAIPVDVHVHRVSNRIGLAHTKKEEETEVELARLYDKKYWLDINELFVRFGQTICKPIGPLCDRCKVNRYCHYYRFERKAKAKQS